MTLHVQLPRIPRLRALASLLLAAALLIAPATASAGKRYAVNAGGTVKFYKREAKAKIVEQRGKVSGKPFGSGTLILRTKLAARKKLEYSIRLTTSKGAVWGNGTASLTTKGSNASYKGTLTIRGGDGTYKKIRKGTVLNVSGSGPANVRTTTVKITGSVVY
ncbi:MAG: hypothetical protein QM679_12185 [Patulibacter sp.]